MSNERDISEFSYEITVAGDIAIVCLLGDIHNSFSLKFEECHKELCHLDSFIFILNMSKIERIYQCGHRFLCLLQHNIRSNNERKVFHFGVDDRRWGSLYAAGILKKSEKESNLRDCVKKAKKILRL